MSIDPERIDVNVHPTKQEIKFQDERLIYNYLKVATRHALGQYSLSPILDFEQEGAMQHMKKGDVSTGPKKEKVGDEWRSLYEGLEEEARKIDKSTSSPQTGAGLFHDKEGQGGEHATESPEAERDLFQLSGKYIISPIKSGILVVDQDAAIERIWYEFFLESIDRDDTLVQQALFPKTFECNPADLAIMEEILPILNNLGFDVQEFGHGTFVIHGVPASFEGLDLDEEAVVLETIAAYREDKDEKDIQQRVAGALAKGSKGQGSKKLSKEEMRALVDQLFACESPYATPGGKRCFITIEKGELHRRF